MTGAVSVVTSFRTSDVDPDPDGRPGAADVVRRPRRGGRPATPGRSSRASTRSSSSPGSAPTTPGSARSSSTSTASSTRPAQLAGEIHPAWHSCGAVTPHGADRLRQPEPGLYLAGMKSYGRAPSFLAMTGFEQVRSIVAEVAGDHEAADRVELVLPDTGVCGGSGLFDEAAADGGCCGTAAAPEPITIGARTVPIR